MNLNQFLGVGLRLLIDTQGKWFEYNNVSKPYDAFMGFQLLNTLAWPQNSEG